MWPQIGQTAGRAWLAFYWTVPTAVWSTGDTPQNDLGAVYVWVRVVRMHLLASQNREPGPLVPRSGNPHF